MQGIPLEVPIALKVKAGPYKSNTMPQLISSLEIGINGPIFLPQPAILHGIIASLLNYVDSPASYLLMGYNPLNSILLVVTCNNRIKRPLLGPKR